VHVLGAGGGLGGPAHTGGNFGENPPNLRAAPHDWGFAKKLMQVTSIKNMLADKMRYK